MAVNKVQRKVGLDALRRLIEKTPVDTGRAKGNWQVGINQRPQGALEAEDKSGSATFAKGAAAIATSHPFCEIHLTNNVQYILALENGHSQQAARGMLSVTLEELMEVFR